MPIPLEYIAHELEEEKWREKEGNYHHCYCCGKRYSTTEMRQIRISESPKDNLPAWQCFYCIKDRE